MKTMTQYVQEQLLKRKCEVAIDFTMGNGNDTLTLSKLAKKVYSFDIQEIALIKTKRLLNGADNVELILDGHENFDHYVQAFDIGIFNLGYLPQGNHSITTKATHSLTAIRKAVDCLNHKGQLFIVVYIGHPEGKEESLKIDEYISSLDHMVYNVALFKMMNKLNAPYVIEIEKR